MSRVQERETVLLVFVVTAVLAGACDHSTAASAKLQPIPDEKTDKAEDHADSPNPSAVADSAPVLTDIGGTPKTVFSGTTEPHRRSTIAPRVSGIVSKVFVVEGQEVAQGDKIATLDASDFQLRVRQAQAGLNLARVNRRAVQREWERTQQLVADNAAPTIQFDIIDSQRDAAEGGVTQGVIGVAMARKAVRNAVIVAPYSGVITRKMVSEGEWAGAMPPTPIAIIEEISVIDLRFHVPELLMTKVVAGTRVVVTFAATKEERVTRVTRVIPSIDPRSRSFSAIVEMDNADKSLRPGMFAEVRFDAPARGQ